MRLRERLDDARLFSLVCHARTFSGLGRPFGLRSCWSSDCKLWPFRSCRPASRSIENLPSWPQLALHAVYLQNVFGYDNISVGFWTLCIEMQFYLLFALLLGVAQQLTMRFGGRQGKASSLALTAMFLPLALVSLFWLSIDGGLTDCYAVHFFIYFFLGRIGVLDSRRPHAEGAAVGLAGRGRGAGSDPLEAGLVRGRRAASAIYLCGAPATWENGLTSPGCNGSA